MTEKLKVLDMFCDIPKYIQNKIYDALTDDILERYDNEVHHNEDIIHNILQDYGYKLKD